MVGTLIKHEALRTTPMLGAILGIATLVVALAGGISVLAIQGISQLSAVLGLLVCAAFPVAINIVMAIDFWRTGWGRQGYFTHSIPVRGSTILTARILWSVAVVVAAVLWAIAALVFMLWLGGTMFQDDGPSFKAMLPQLVGMMGQVMPWWQWALALGLLIFVVWFHLMGFYFPATIGSGPRWARLGSRGPIAVWAITYVVIQLILVASIFLPVAADYSQGSWRLRIVDMTILLTQQKPSYFPVGVILTMVVIAVVFVVWMARSWDRRVSLR